MKMYYSTSEIAKMLSLSTQTVRYWEKKGIIESVRIEGGHMRFSIYELEKLNPQIPVDLRKFYEEDSVRGVLNENTI